MAATRINVDEAFPLLVKGSLLLTALLALLTALLVSARFGSSLLAGGLLATANFCWLRRALQGALQLDARVAHRFATLRYLLRLAVMALLLYLLIVKLAVDVFGLLAGLSVLVAAIIIFSLLISTREGGSP